MGEFSPSLTRHCRLKPWGSTLFVCFLPSERDTRVGVAFRGGCVGVSMSSGFFLHLTIRRRGTGSNSAVFAVRRRAFVSGFGGFRWNGGTRLGRFSWRRTRFEWGCGTDLS